jgi:CRP-like cAMP-binding protein
MRLQKPGDFMIDALLLNLTHRDFVSEEEKSRLRELVGRERTFGPGEDIVIEGSRPTYSTLMVDGLSARYKHMADGSRQITALQVPGDFVDLHAFLLKKLDHGIVAISTCRVAFADHADLREYCNLHHQQLALSLLTGRRGQT